MILTDGGTLPIDRGPIITTINGHQFTVNDPEFDVLRIGQAAFFDGQLLVIIEIDRERRIVSAARRLKLD